ncbi:MAG: cbhB, partial [Phycisphaerales bacterium]|nr:cbhB [Phycisphaerales bacterium]
TATEGQPLASAKLATFTDTHNAVTPVTSASDYVASVSWGDGNLVSTNVSVAADTDPADPGGFVVTASGTVTSPDALIVTEVQYASGSSYHGRPASLGEPVVAMVPAAPSGLTVTSAATAGVALSWSDNSVISPGFTIERSADGTNYDPLDYVDPGVTSYVDTSPLEGASYYRIEAVNNSGVSTPSNVATTNLPLAVPDLTVRAVSDTEVDLSWVNNSQTAAGFTIERSVGDDLHFSPLTTFSDPTVNTFADMTGMAGTRYYYRVDATAPGFAAADSAEEFDTTVPPTPTSLSVSSSTATAVNLAWNPAAGATGYRIWRKDASSDYFMVDEIGGGAGAYADATVSDGSAYTYAVQAFNNAGASDLSVSTDAATLLGVPGTPIDVATQAISDTEIVVTWAPTGSGSQTFTVQRSGDEGATWSTAGQTAAGATTFADTGVPEPGRYDYRVVAHDSGGDSPASAPSSATAWTAPVAPLAENDFMIAYSGHPNEFQIASGGQIYYGVTWNDPGISPTSVALKDAPSHGTAVFHDGDAVTYTPDAGFTGLDSFTYTAGPNIPPATVTVNVNPYAGPSSPPPPGFGPERGLRFDVEHGDTLAVSANDGLLFDLNTVYTTDTAALVTPAMHGTVTVNADGSFTYVAKNPATGKGDFIGWDYFTYVAATGTAFGTSAPETVAIDITDSPPQVLNSPWHIQTLEGQSVSVPADQGVLSVHHASYTPPEPITVVDLQGTPPRRSQPPTAKCRSVLTARSPTHPPTGSTGPTRGPTA